MESWSSSCASFARRGATVRQDQLRVLHVSAEHTARSGRRGVGAFPLDDDRFSLRAASTAVPQFLFTYVLCGPAALREKSCTLSPLVSCAAPIVQPENM